MPDLTAAQGLFQRLDQVGLEQLIEESAIEMVPQLEGPLPYQIYQAEIWGYVPLHRPCSWKVAFLL